MKPANPLELPVIRRNFSIATAALLLTSLGSLRAAEGDSELKIGMLSGMFRDVQPAMVQAMAKPFRDLMLKTTSFTGEVEILDDPIELADKLKNKKLQLGVFHGFEFAWAQQKCDELVPLIVTLPPGGVVQGLIVVHIDNPAKSVADLGNSGIGIPRGAKAHSIAYLAKARSGLEGDCAKPTPQIKLTPEDILNAVASGEQKAALVDRCALDGYKMLQPGGFKALKILAQSEEFPAAVVCYVKGALSEDQAARIRTGLTGATKTPSGKMLMTLWNLKGFSEPSKDYQGSLDTILKAYPMPKAAMSVEGSKTKAVGPNGGK